MRILYQLLVVLFVMLQAAAGQRYIPGRFNSCAARNGICIPGICRRPFYWAGRCSNGLTCCKRGWRRG
ncbi:hypothetical protein Q9966_007432 [Columba livia]|uniref:Beta-defensin-like domain-containing protein n=1 Tax=Columba livia TaxID=8932 RepID=A0A2I0MTQ8_COLLI|nr:hypothetical protein Q9233_016745 [Columba guinea]KAK2534008.1 hypothetical protein Q9966_007432 [Columba livia]PKK33064.1 hypothetical protein A306_00000054 [Columba livia]